MASNLAYLDFDYLTLAIFVLILFVLLFVARKKFNFNADEFILSILRKVFPALNKKKQTSISNSNLPNAKSLVLVDVGANKATVTATLRQIMGIDLPTAQGMVEKLPSTIMTNITEKEANINKAALEFVGAKLEIK